MKKRHYFLSLLSLSLTFVNAVSQPPFVKEKRDYIWLLGYNSNPIDVIVGGTRINFNFSPPARTYVFRDLDFDATNASICDTAGNLLFYTNGIAIHAPTIPQGQQIVNGGGLNPDTYTQEWAGRGYNLIQGALILAVPDSVDEYYLLHGEKTTFPEELNGSYRITHRLYLSKIGINENGQGVVTLKNHPLISDTLDYGKITAVRHANGRDWWILQQEFFSSRFYKLLVSPQGVSLEEDQVVGIARPSGLGQAVFSPDGSKYAKIDIHYIGQDQYLNIFDFNRCTGTLFNPLQITYRDTAVAAGLAISPNSRFLYVSSFRYVYQYDLWAEDIEASRETIAVYDGFQSPPPLATTFFLCQLAPDNKIYISASNTVRYFHVIHNPNGQGADCQIKQHDFLLPTFNAFGIPNSPYYGLGPEDGSPCDTLGIDHYPQAAFRNFTQELEATFWDYSLFFPNQWQWDFGDGAAGSTEQNPVHIYQEPGIYEVCLTVSNDHASDTHCEMVEITVTSTKEVDSLGMAVKLYPNPATDYVIIEPQQHLPPETWWTMHDAFGRELRRAPLPEGQPQLLLNLEGLPAGVYFYRLQAEGKMVWQGKILKQ